MCGTVDEVTENVQWNYTVLPSLVQLLQLLVRTFPSKEYSLLLLLCHARVVCAPLWVRASIQCMEVYCMTDLIMLVVFVRYGHAVYGIFQEHYIIYY